MKNQTGKYIAVLLILLFADIAGAGPQNTSGVTTDEVIVDVQFRLNAISESGVTDPFYSNTELVQWINDGMLDISVKTGCLQDTETVSMVTGQIEYTIVADYITITSAVLSKADTSKVGLRKSNIWSVGRIQSSFDPAEDKLPDAWYEFDGKIGFFPAYEILGGTPSVDVYMSIIPGVIASGETILTPAMYDKALTLYVEAQGHKKAGKITAYTQTIEDYLTELKIDLAENSQAIVPEEVVE